MKLTPNRHLILFLLSLGLVFSACGPKASTPPEDSGNGRLELEKVTGLVFELSEGQLSATPRSAGTKVVDTTPLSEARVEEILARLGDAPVAPKTEDFALRTDSLAPPRKGQRLQDSFKPASTTAPTVEPAALLVTRAAPQGDVPLAPKLSITFSQPMVALTSHSEASKLTASRSKTLPVTLTPEPPGTWRWVGTRTLVFAPDGGRFPMATRYTAGVAKGTQSALTSGLEADYTWSFATPTLQVETTAPAYGPTDQRPILLLTFNQRVDVNTLAKTLRLEAAGKTWAFDVVDTDSVATDDRYQWVLQNSQADRRIAIRPNEDLPLEASISLTLQEGSQSAEGPLPTPNDQTSFFQVHGAFEITEHHCGYEGCRPWDSFELSFTNPIDAENFDPKLVTIEPKIPHPQIYFYNNNLSIYGATAGRTTYTVTLDPKLKDRFGGTLEGERSVTFDVGDPYPGLSGSHHVILDPASKPSLSVFSSGYDEFNVRLLAVEPGDYAAFLKFRDEFLYGGLAYLLTPPPGTQKAAFKLDVDTSRVSGAQNETRIDLSPALGDKTYGNVVVIVQPTHPNPDAYYREAVVTWVQRSDIALSAFSDTNQVLVWATDLATGKALEGVEVSAVEPAGASVKTGPDGLARLPGDRAKKGLIARKGDDVSLLPWENYYAQTLDPLVWYVTDDRHLYKPGETVHLKGWIRHGDASHTALSLLDDALEEVRYAVTDSMGNEIVKGVADIGSKSGFDFAFELPDNANLGYTSLTLSLDSAQYLNTSTYHSFEIQEFRRPEFEIKTEHAGGPYFVGGSADVTVDALYYTGGALPDAEVYWNVTAVGGSFTPPNRDDYTFGTWTPWWSWSDPYGAGYTYKSLASRTNSDGRHALHIDLQSMNPPRTMVVSAAATVTDVNRQAWSDTATLLIHPADHYVGMKSSNWFVEPGEKVDVDLIVSDLDGTLIDASPIRVEAAFMAWKEVDGVWSEVPDGEPEVCNALSRGAAAVPCSFTFDSGGSYRIRSFIVDPSGRPNRSELTLWVAGGDQPPSRTVSQESVTLIPSGKIFAPGDVAKILVQSPLEADEALVTVRHQNLESVSKLELDHGSATLEVPITANLMGGAWVRVDVMGSASRLGADGKPNADLPRRPAFAAGVIQLDVSTDSQRLTIEVKPANAVLEPGGKTTLDVAVRDAHGNPVADADVLLVVVDESVLALSTWELVDPMQVFFALGYPSVYETYSHTLIALETQPELLLAEGQMGALGNGNGILNGNNSKGLYRAEVTTLMPASTPMAQGQLAQPKEAQQNTRSPAKNAPAKGKQQAGKKGEAAPIGLRQNFDALALFLPDAKTDAAGRTSVEVTLPDTLTRYRIIAVAADVDRFGKGESTLQARLDLMVRPSAPRFLNYGDTFELPVVLQNQSDTAMEVEVAVRAQNAELTAGAGRKVSVPANDRVEVRFPAKPLAPGEVAFQMAAVSMDHVDAAEARLPVWSPSTTEAFALYGEIDKGAIIQPFSAPKDAIPDFGELQVSTSSTALHALSDAVLYLVDYPFECSEQLSSRLLAIASMKDVLAAFDAEGLPKPEALEASVDRDIAFLKARQNWDGGFPWWRWGQESSPYLTVHVGHALARAQKAGFKVDVYSIQNLQYYLRSIESYIPYWYSVQSKYAILSYALYVRQLLGEDVVAEALAIYESPGLETLSLESVGWLYAVMVADEGSRQRSVDALVAIRTHLTNRASEEAGTAHFAENYSDGAQTLLVSDRRTDAVILDALLRDDPKSDLAVKLVNGLLGHRVAGRWTTTQENAFVLVALGQYFELHEKEEPNFTSRAWLGDGYAGEHKFEGRSTDRYELSIPMATLSAGPAEQNLVIQKEGTGRLYYRIALRYAPVSLELPATDHGFEVSRSYEAIDSPDDVSRDDQGVWHIKAGAKVRVRLGMVSPDRRYHVALVDKMPAGFEALNPALAVSEAVPADPNTSNIWWWGTWYEHQNLRDERVEAFTTLLWEGVYEYTYVARATTPGRFIAPPTKAEEMYSPETFGRSAVDVVVVE